MNFIVLPVVGTLAVVLGVVVLVVAREQPTEPSLGASNDGGRGVSTAPWSSRLLSRAGGSSRAFLLGGGALVAAALVASWWWSHRLPAEPTGPAPVPTDFAAVQDDSYAAPTRTMEPAVENTERSRPDGTPGVIARYHYADIVNGDGSFDNALARVYGPDKADPAGEIQVYVDSARDTKEAVQKRHYKGVDAHADGIDCWDFVGESAYVCATEYGKNWQLVTAVSKGFTGKQEYADVHACVEVLESVKRRNPFSQAVATGF